MDRTTTKTFLTARLRSKQPVAAVGRTLVGALDALGAERAAGGWKPTEVSAVRASCRDSAGGSWTWRADDAPARAHDPAGPKQRDAEQAEDVLASAGRFALFLSAMAQ